MTVQEIRLIQQSWATVEPVAETAAVLFYQRLFELDPSLRPLFGQTDMKEQRKKLMQTLAVVVRGVARLDELMPAVMALGSRHAGYGVRAEHYATVGEALLWTLEQGLGDAFTPETRAAWAAAYDALSGAMLAAAETGAALAA